MLAAYAAAPDCRVTWDTAPPMGVTGSDFPTLDDVQWPPRTGGHLS